MVRSVNQLKKETGEASRSMKQNTESAQMKNWKLDSRAYKALFNRKLKKVKVADQGKEGHIENCRGSVSKQVSGDIESTERKGKELVEGVTKACDKVSKGPSSSPSKSVVVTLGTHNGLDVSNSRLKSDCMKDVQDSENRDAIKASASLANALIHGHIAKKMHDDAGKVQVDCSVTENLQRSELIDSTLNGRTLDENVNTERFLEVKPHKGKGNIANNDPHGYEVVTSADICTSIADDVPLLPSGSKSIYLSETCDKFTKKRRVCGDPTPQELCTGNPKLIKQMSETSNVMGELDSGITTRVADKYNNLSQRSEFRKVIQIDGDPNTCLICNLGGMLLCCNGKYCKRSYHLSCLDPPLEDVPLGAWHCPACVWEKIKSGVHSVSEGVESIWDDREIEISGAGGLQKEKQFFVKYKGLAHVHNRWIPETQLCVEAPLLISQFNQRNQAASWKPEWTLPHRLLHRRLLMSPKQRFEYCSAHPGVGFDCHYEWLVKWKGLSYEHATWELENASFFNSPEVQGLIIQYWGRSEKAQRDFSSNIDKITETEKGSLVKLGQLPAGNLPGGDSNYLDCVNKLREFWHKSRNAVLIDDSEGILKVILFILSLQSDISRPFLIIAASAALDSWEAEFSYLTPFLNVVVYNGAKNVRKDIRTLEFYEERGCIMFQVLISPPEVIVEDIEVLQCVGWEAVIIECRQSRTFTHFEQIKMLTAEMNILLVNELKDSTSDYLNFLSLLGSTGNVNNTGGSKTNSIDNIGKLKERLSKYTIHESKPDSSRFLEFWVPAQLSNIQLEQYCATLLSNSMALRSSSKNDLVGALHNILITIRKCCDHPYIGNLSLQTLLTRDLQVVEHLDVGVKASGKLQVLDSMLSEIKNRGLRVLILCQSIVGSGRDSVSIVDILDDFLRQRFGEDSYERVDGGLLPSKKQAAMNTFNTKESGRFVFLLETRACLASIRLSSVDTVIIYNSDWNPINDVRALQKIKLDMQFEKVKVFRLYSCCTVEERVLILAKKEMITDRNFLIISRCHKLLMWGASYLFNKLEDFHGTNTTFTCASTLADQSILENVIKEFSTILLQNGKNNDSKNASIILRVKQNGATYRTNLSLLGELKIQLLDEELPHIFWTRLLEGKHPRWKYAPLAFQRNRKRLQQCDNSSKNLEFESGKVANKRKKVINNSMAPHILKHRRDERKMLAGNKEGASCTNDMLPANKSGCEDQVAEFEEGSKLQDEQRSLFLLVKPKISRLCETLQLSEDVKGVVELFLEYVINDHQVPQEPATILQAFQISLCWTAASLLKHKIDHKRSLALAREHLNFGCAEEETEYVYSKLQCLKTMFRYCIGHPKVADSPKGSAVAAKEVSKGSFCTGVSKSISDLKKVTAETEEDWSKQQLSKKEVLSKWPCTPISELVKKDISKSIKRIQKKCHKQRMKLIRKQEEEVRELNKIYTEERERLEKKHKIELAVVRNCHDSNMSVKADKLKVLDYEYAKKIEQHKCKMNRCLTELGELHLAKRNKEQKRASCWEEEVKSWAQAVLLEKLPSDDPAVGRSSPINKVTQPVMSIIDDNELDAIVAVGDSVSTEQQSCANSLAYDPENPVSVNSCSEDKIPDEAMSSIQDGLVPLEVPETVDSIASPVNTVTLNFPSSEEENDEATICMYDVEVPLEVPESSGLHGDRDNVFTINSHPSTLYSLPDGEAPLVDPESTSFVDGLENVSTILHTSEQQICGSDLLNKGEGEVPLGLLETISSIQRSDIVNLPISQVADGDVPPLSVADGEVPLRVTETLNSNDGSENFVPINPPLLGEHIPDGGMLSLPNGEVQLREPDGVVPSGMPQTVSSIDDPENIVCVNPQTSGRQNSGAASSIYANRVGEQNGEGNIFSREPLLQDPSLTYPLSMQRMNTLAQVDSLSLSQALEDGHYLAGTSAGVQGTETAASEVRITPQIEPSPSDPADVVPFDQCNNLTAVREPEMHLQLPPSTDSTFSSHNPPYLPPADEIEHHQTNEDHISLQNSHASVHLAEQTEWHPTQTSPPVVHLMPMPFCHDPLQNELEKLYKQTQCMMKIHEDTKLQLKSDCDKEVEEFIAQTRKKHDCKLREIEDEFQLKKKELGSNINKVVMTKVLAEAFRSKCEDRSAVAPELPQDATSSFRQQLGQLLLQQTAQRPSPAASLQTASLYAAVPQTMPPSFHSVSHSSAIFTNIPTIPPHISPICPSICSVQVSSDIRAPAPHLQPFRSSMSMTTAHVMPCHLTLTSNPIRGFPSPTQLPSQQSLAIYQSGTSCRAHQPESARVLQAPLQYSSLSALELFLDIDERTSANMPNILPLQSDSGTNFHQLHLTQFPPHSSMLASPANLEGTNNIIYLLDDD